MRGAALVAVLFLLLAAPAAAVHEKGPPPQYCEHGVVRDYLTPFRDLPKLRSAPDLRGLPFGSRGVFLREPLALRERGGFVGYTLGLPRSREARLDWDLSLSLFHIDPDGKANEAWGKRTHVGRLDGRRRIGFRLSSKPALYRIAIAIRDASGKLLGTYGEYLRVLERERDVRASLSATAVRPGETISARVENYGTGSVILEAPYAIEAFDGTSWARASISPLTPDPLVGLATGPGGAVTCWRFGVPADASAGRYRLVGEVLHSWGWLKAPLNEIPLAPEFEILPPA